MQINISDIPPGKTFRDYPSDTVFVLDEPQLVRHYDKNGNRINEDETNSDKTKK